MTEPIDWSQFESKYYMPEPGRPVKVILANPQQEWRTFKDSTTPKLHALFDVLRINDVQFRPGDKLVSTANRRLIMQLRKAFELEKNGVIFIDWWQDGKHNHTITLLHPDGSPKVRFEVVS